MVFRIYFHSMRKMRGRLISKKVHVPLARSDEEGCETFSKLSNSIRESKFPSAEFTMFEISSIETAGRKGETEVNHR